MGGLTHKRTFSRISWIYYDLAGLFLGLAPLQLWIIKGVKRGVKAENDLGNWLAGLALSWLAGLVVCVGFVSGLAWCLGAGLWPALV